MLLYKTMATCRSSYQIPQRRFFATVLYTNMAVERVRENREYLFSSCILAAMLVFPTEKMAVSGNCILKKSRFERKVLLVCQGNFPSPQQIIYLFCTPKGTRILDEPIAVITVEPAHKTSLVYSCMQTRLKAQYNGKWPINLVCVSKPLITVITAIVFYLGGILLLLLLLMLVILIIVLLPGSEDVDGLELSGWYQRNGMSGSKEDNITWRDGTGH